MKARGANARGIAVVDDKTPDSEFDAMYRAGVRGTGSISRSRPDRSRRRPAPAARRRDRFKNRKWDVELYTNLGVVSEIKDLVATSPVPTVFDHFGGASAAAGRSNPASPISSNWCVQAGPT